MIEEPSNVNSYRRTNFKDNGVLKLEDFYLLEGFIFNKNLKSHSYLSKDSKGNYIYKLIYGDNKSENYKFSIEKKGFANYLINLDDLYAKKISFVVPDFFDASLNIRGMDYDINKYSILNNDGSKTFEIEKIIKLDESYIVTLKNDAVGEFTFDLEVDLDDSETVSSVLNTAFTSDFEFLIEEALKSYYDSAFKKVSAIDYCKEIQCDAEKLKGEYEKVTAYQSTVKILNLNVTYISDISFAESNFYSNIFGNIELRLDGNSFSFYIDNAELNFKLINNKLFIISSIGLPTEFYY